MIWLILLLAIISTLLGGAGALCLKLANPQISFFKLISNPYLISGAALYIVASIIFIFALKLGELSYVYPLTALSYIWVAIGARAILKEKLNIWKAFGISLIILGVVLISLQ